MESSDDDTLSERSCVSEPSFRSERSGGSLSPCTSGLVGPPGDTLPWNLSKHERRKRKSQDSVLDPAERAVVRVAGEDKNLTSVWRCGTTVIILSSWSSMFVSKELRKNDAENYFH
uniref:Microtubule-actin cross-linking factor 1 n=1 Tax=Oryzias latipes TaxID=8090 RepID=A0A3P9H0G6_ORYLA